MTTRQTRSGFTLTELLVVMSVIIILMAMLVVCVDGLYTYAVRLQCQHRMEQIWDACVMYSSTNRILPNAWDYDHGRPWYVMLTDEGYLDSSDVYTCPSSDLVSRWGEGHIGSQPEGPVDDELAGLMTMGLWYLYQRQEGAGSWAPAGSATRCSVTALCLLAFLGAGRSDTDPQFGGTVKGAVDYLISREQGSGFFEGNMYTQGLVLMALADASRFCKTTEYQDKARDAAQLALNYVLGQHITQGGFHYDYNTMVSENHCDQSVSVWVYQGIAAAYNAGLNFDPNGLNPDPDHFTRSMNWASRVTFNSSHCHRGNGHTHYRSDASCIGEGGAEGGRPRRLTGAVLAARLLLGQDNDDQQCIDMAEWLWRTPRYNAGGTGGDIVGFVSGNNNLYAMYYATLAMFMMGGSSARNHWTDWVAVYIPLLVNGFVTNGTVTANGETHDKGYWPIARDVYPCQGHAPSTDFVTALAILSLEVLVGQYIPDSKWFAFSVAGDHSYGYNKLIANDNYGRRTPAGDTIVLMDYMRAGIDPLDPVEHIAPRHGGKANVLFGDGHIEALAYEDLIEERPGQPGEYRIKRQMLSLEPGPEGHLAEDE